MNHQEVERLAYWLWKQRGMPMGSPDEDWLLAEQLVKRRYGPFVMPLFFGLEERTR